MGLGGSTGAIRHLSSEWRCFLVFPPGAAYPLPKPAQATPNLPIPWFAPQPMATLPMPQCIRPTLGNIAHMHRWPTLSPTQSSRGDVASWQAPVPLTPQLVRPPCDSSAHWQESSPLTSLFVLPPHGNVAPRRVPVPPTPQLIWLPRGGVTHWRARVPPTPK